MEKFVCTKDCKVGHFQDEILKGQEFNVVRNIRSECVLIVKEEKKPNIIATEEELKKNGTLTGEISWGW